MQQDSDAISRIEHPSEMQAALEALTQPGGASLMFESPGSEPLPALVVYVRQGEGILVDITAIADIAPAIEKGRLVYLVGQSNGSMLRTPVLENIEWLPRQNDRLRFACDYPSHVEIMHRRSAYRAELKPGMEARATLLMARSEVPVSGALRNLSLGGCLLELPLAAAMSLQPEQSVQGLVLDFPSGQQLRVPAKLRHVQGDSTQQVARIGCEFLAVDPQVEREIWFFVREIEREGARYGQQDARSLAPSPLFESRGGAVAPPSRPHGADYATPMARRLAKISAYLDTQLLGLQEGERIAPRDLSRHSDQLLGLLEEDREALLFASVCMVDDHPLVQHGIAVAVRLVDWASSQRLSRDVLKAMAACALVHDFGKILLPNELRHTQQFSNDDKRRMAEHVSLLDARMVDCRWLSPEVVNSVIWRINERLDGSGYPQGLAQRKVDSLSRMAAVIDVVDAMGRERADRKGRTVSQTYRHLLSHGEAFDLACVERYVKHFGIAPIGGLARFSNGQLAWIQRLDKEGRPRQVQVAPADTLPRNDLGEVLIDSELARLGKLEALVVPAVG